MDWHLVVARALYPLWTADYRFAESSILSRSTMLNMVRKIKDLSLIT
jgi:hypothetical protein